MRRFMIPALAAVAIAVGPAAAQTRVILDTDIGGDADDLGALAMLHTLVDAGEAELLAVMSWSNEEYAVAAIDAVNRWYGHPGIPVAGRKEAIWHDAWQYNRPVVEALGGARRTWRDVPDPTTLYRRVLAGQPDDAVTLVTIGPLLNIRRLLESPPDSIDARTGRELVAAKVEEVVVMGGEFPVGEGEWNFSGDMPGVTRAVLSGLEEAAVPVTFLGYEIGVRVRTGEVFNALDPSHPLHAGFLHFSEHAEWINDDFEGEILDNASYDQTAVLYAVRGGIGRWWSRVDDGRVEVDEAGNDRWVAGEASRQSYLVLEVEPGELAAVIEALMLGDDEDPDDAAGRPEPSGGV